MKYCTARTFGVGTSLVACATLGLVGGCAVSPGELTANVSAAEQKITTFQKSADDQRAAQEPPFLRIKGNYLGSTSMPISAGLTLPARFRNVVLNYGRSDGSFVEAAQNVRSATGLSVRFNQDIYTNLSSPPGGQSLVSVPAPAPLSAVQPAAVALPGGPLPAGGVLNIGVNRTGMVAQNPAQPAPQTIHSPAHTQVPLNYAGDLADYLNMITAAAGVSWQFENGELYFYRLVTRTFSVDLMPRTIEMADLTNGGGQTSLSSGSGSGGSGSSSTTSTSTANFISKYDPLNDFAAAVRSLLTPWGKLTPNVATGTFVVTDTKAVVDRVASFIASENAKLMTRVDVEIRTISLTVNDTTELGANFNLVYNALSSIGTAGASNWGLVFSAPTSAVSTTSGTTPGTATYSNTNPSSRWNGSSISVDALNTFGKISSDTSQTIQARNRVPSEYQNVTDYTYLATTTPATGGGTSGGTGVPGLTPGLVTYGTFLTVTPSVSDSGTVTVNLSSTASNLVAVKSASTGTGQTFQQITLPTLNRTKTGTDLVIPKGASAVTVSSVGDNWNGTSNVGIGGASVSRNHSKVITILVVTPHVYPGA